MQIIATFHRFKTIEMGFEAGKVDAPVPPVNI